MAATLIRKNSSEGGGDGTTITTGNSGGQSGDAWNTVTIGTNATETYSQDKAGAHGALALKIVEPATGASTRVDWTGLGGGTADTWFRLYLYLTANPAAQLVIANTRTVAAAASAHIRISSTGLVQGCNAALTQINTGTVPIVLNAWARIEFRVRASTTVGQLEWRLFNTADSKIADDTASSSGAVLGAETDQIRFGVTTNPVSSYTCWFDDMAVSLTDWIGPPDNPVNLNTEYSRFPKPRLRRAA